MSTLSSISRSIDESTTGSSSAAVAVAVGHRDGDVKSSRANKKITADERKSDYGYNVLKENGCHTTDDTGTDLTDSIAKETTHNNDVDEDASIQSQSQPQEATFPQQLMDLIESETTDDNAVIIRGQKAIEWLSTGDKFIIRDKKAIESLVLPKYFKTKSIKFMSFVRKLYR